jgi:hypothetical protein
MKKFLLLLTFVGLLVVAMGATAGAQSPTVKNLALADPSAPTVTAVDPASGANDIDAPVTISGTDFVATPTVSLGSTALTSVTWVNSTTLTAAVPWGLNPGAYGITVVNPDGGSGTLAGAFTVTQGIGQWNGGDLFGGDVHQILMKPGVPSTLYAPAAGLRGLFRSTDAGATWQYTGGGLSLAGKLAVDAQHPGWLWAYGSAGVQRSTDEGDTWTTVLSAWPDGRQINNGQVYPSPHDSQVLFVSSHYDSIAGGSADGAQGLIRSADGGATWTPVDSVAGESVDDVAFDPAQDSQKMVLVTQDAKVYHSGDAGVNWDQVASPPVSSIGFNETLAYNPYASGQVWIVSDNAPDKVFKSTDAVLSGWQDMTPPAGYLGGSSITFTGADSVYVTWLHSTNGGADWTGFGPTTGVYQLIFDPANAQVGYVGDRTYGVQKTTNGGQDWQPANQGLTGMTCSSLDVSASDPLHVFATFGLSPGVYDSKDGAGTWGYAQVPGSYPIMEVVRTDPTDSSRVYALSGSGIYRSIDKGATWDDRGWHPSVPTSSGGIFCLEPDPFATDNLLVAFDSGDSGCVYASSDAGDSWQAATMPSGVKRITDIAFDPQTPGLVYCTSGGMGAMHGSGVYRSTDHGATWTRIDDLAQPGMRDADTIAIAYQPQPMLFVATFGEYAYRSTDGGATWQATQGGHGHCLFANGDSTRLYASDSTGLCFSSDGGDTWTRAAGLLGQLQILALGCAVADGHTILYAATNGGEVATSGGAAVGRRGAVRATASTLVDAGIYRYAQVAQQPTTCTLTKKSGTISYGAKTTITGTLKVAGTTMGLRGCYAQLQYSSNGSTFVNAGAPRMTAAGGAFSFTVAPTTKTFYRVTFAGSGGYYQAANSAKIYLIPRVYLTAPTAPSVAYRNRAFTSTALLKPRHTARTYAVKLQCYRYERQRNGTYKWVLRKTISAKAANYSSYTKVAARLSLPSAGKWRLRAYHAADTKNAVTYSSYRYLRVR